MSGVPTPLSAQTSTTGLIGVLVRNVSPAAKLAPLPAAGGVHPPLGSLTDLDVAGAVAGRRPPGRPRHSIPGRAHGGHGAPEALHTPYSGAPEAGRAAAFPPMRG
jgi:hypothetical protein